MGGYEYVVGDDSRDVSAWLGVAPRRFRDVMASVSAPVTVVTTASTDGPHGTTASSFTPRRAGQNWRRWSTPTICSEPTLVSPSGYGGRSPIRPTRPPG